MKRILLVGFVAAVWGTGLGCRAASAANDNDNREGLNGEAEDKTLSPYFVVEGAEGGGDAFPLKSTRVSAVVSGVIANVTVKQVYENQGATPLHARYVFPASTRAAVHGLTLRVGDRAVVARIKEREQANQEFEAAKREGKTATKLDEERPNVFTMSLANVMPKDRVEVELAYTELLVPTAGVYEFVYPTVVGPRYATADTAASGKSAWVNMPFLHAGQASPATFDIDVAIAAGMPLSDVRSPSHAVTVTGEREGLARVALKQPGGEAGNRDFILAYRLTGPQIGTGLLLHEKGDEKFFLLMVQPPVAVNEAVIPPREYIFVLDVSGSMHGFPLDTAKKVIRELIGHLRPNDSFNVILFSGASRLMAPSSLAATPANIERAINVIDHEQGGGGTELEGALKMALKLPRERHVSRTIAVVTDGYIAEEPGAFALVRENLHDTNVFAFGIGSGVNRHLIEGLAHLGQGEPFVVTDPSQAEATAGRFRQYIESPVLTNIKVTAPGFDVYDVEPAAQPDLFAERPILVYGKWKGARTGQFVVTGRTGKGDFRATIPIADLAPRAENAALPRLWARARIQRLSDFGDEAHDPEAVQQVTSLGLTYSLLTAHTSFIAVMQEARNPGGAGKDVTQPSAMPQGVSELAVAESYGCGAEPELWLLAALALAAAAMVVARRHLVAVRA